MAVDPFHRYSNKLERAKYDIYGDFKLKNLLVSMVFTKIFQRFKVQCWEGVADNGEVWLPSNHRLVSNVDLLLGWRRRRPTHIIPLSAEINLRCQIYNEAPAYISEMLTPYTTPKTSTNTSLLTVPTTHTKHGDRAFSCAAPRL